MNYKIKQFTGDQAKLTRMPPEHELNQISLWNDAKFCLRFPGRSRAEVWFAYDKSKMIGFIVGRDYQCWYIGVLPEYRMQGVGTALVKTSGLWHPKDVLPSAIEFWESLGSLV